MKILFLLYMFGLLAIAVIAALRIRWGIENNDTTPYATIIFVICMGLLCWLN